MLVISGSIWAGLHFSQPGSHRGQERSNEPRCSAICFLFPLMQGAQSTLVFFKLFFSSDITALTTCASN